MSVDSIERRLDGYALLEMAAEKLARLCVSVLGWKLDQRSTDPTAALVFLSEFTLPATRHVILEGHRGWSVMLDNTPNADVDRVPFMAARLHTRALRVVHSPERRWQQPGKPEYLLTHEARIVQYSDRSADILKSVYLSASKGEQATFEVHDATPDQIPLRAYVDASKRNKRERFTADQLGALLNAFGAQVITGADFAQARAFILLHDPAVKAVPKGTPAERDNPAQVYFQMGVDWSDATHQRVPNWYDSVIRSMEQALVYDPAYQERAQPYLRKAYAARRKHPR